MSQPTVFAGNLDVLALSYLIKSQVHSDQTGDSFRVIAKFPTACYCDKKPIKVMYKYDTQGIPEHFDVVLDGEDTEYHLSPTEFKQFVERSEQSNKIQHERPLFVDLIDFDSRAAALPDLSRHSYCRKGFQFSNRQSITSNIRET